MRPEGVALDGFGQDHRGLSSRFYRCLVGRENLAVIVAAALQRPHFLIAPVFNEFGGPRILSEEMIAHESAVFGLVGLVVPIRGGVHDVDQSSVAVLGEEFIPPATPDDFDDVPAGTAVEGLKFLDDLAVAANRAVEALQVGVDHENEIVQFFAGGKAECANRFHLIHFAIAQESPDSLLRGVLDAAMV